MTESKLLKLGQKFILVYLAVWLIAVAFFMEYSWIRLLIDVPLICLLVIGSAALILQGRKDGVDPLTLVYEGVITFFVTCNYATYLVSESGLLLSTGKNIMDVTIFFWLIINAANLIILYKKDFVESFLKEDEGTVQTLNLEDAMELVKKKYELTNREIEILTEVYNGKTNTQIAEDLFISESTVKAHIYNIFRKMNVKSRVEAVCIIREEKEIKAK
ncbi:MAG: response regulator transcription factor [Firmicutes bacterium]|nr:response regulator transcription factor [Bacillota bacterium]